MRWTLLTFCCASLFVIPMDGGEASIHATTVPSKADVIFAFDTTGSMGGEILTFKSSLSTSVIPQIRAVVPDVAFGIVDFKDFGDPWVVYYRHRIQTVVTSAGVSSLQNVANALSAAGGGDVPEAGWEALYSIAGGPSITVMGYVSTFDLATTYPTSVPAGETQGTVGGAGFRTGSFPIVIAITDAEWHDAPGSGGLNPYSSTFAGVPSRAQTIARLNAINARAISIVAQVIGGDPRTQGRLLAEATGATVSPAQWGAAVDRPAGCGTTQCCTGINLAGEAPSSPGGLCPLVYSLSTQSGTGLDAAAVNGVKMLLAAATPAPTSTAISSSLNPSVTGQPVTLTATVLPAPAAGGTPTGTVTFRDGTTTLGSRSLSAGQATFGTSTLTIGSHSMTATYEGDANFGGSTSSSLSQTVQMIAPPSALAAEAVSPTSVIVSWIASAGSASYQISRSSSGASFGIIGSPTTSPFNDPTASPATAYLYTVRAVDGAGGLSNASNADLATTVIFTDDPLPARTVIKTAHVMQLRTAVQAVRALAALPPATFSDPTIDSTVTIQARHISELRGALDAARIQLALSALIYSDATLTPGATIIKAGHLQELRLGVK